MEQRGGRHDCVEGDAGQRAFCLLIVTQKRLQACLSAVWEESAEERIKFKGGRE